MRHEIIKNEIRNDNIKVQEKTRNRRDREKEITEKKKWISNVEYTCTPHNIKSSFKKTQHENNNHTGRRTPGKPTRRRQLLDIAKIQLKTYDHLEMQNSNWCRIKSPLWYNGWWKMTNHKQQVIGVIRITSKAVRAIMSTTNFS